MPKFLEDQLKAEAARKGKTGRAADRYVYGTMNALGVMRGSQETAKGRAMDRKHDKDAGLRAAHASHPNASRLGRFLHPKRAR